MPVGCEPARAFAPVQASPATQDVAFCDDQLSVAADPLVIVLGIAPKLTVGTAGATEITADCVAMPAGPVQLKVYVVVAASAAVVTEPLSGSVPLQAPDPVHAVALIVVHVTLAVWPAVTELGVALMAMLGAVEATVTVVDWAAVPPGPMQVRINSVVPLSGAVVCEPLVGTRPLQPPEAVQLLAWSDCQLRMVVSPALSVVACAIRLTEGAGSVTMTSADCEDAPPGPLQVSMKVVFAVSASIVTAPLTGFVPVHPPLASQESAPATLHLRVVPAPTATRLGFGCRLMTGPLDVVEVALELLLLSELPMPWQAASTAKLKPLIESLAYRQRVTPRGGLPDVVG